MLKRPFLKILLGVLLAAGFILGIAQLFALRYSTGDIYPPYSTLRADPLGAKVLYEALDEIPGIEVRRNFKPLPKLRPPNPVTLVYAGVPHHAVWTEKELLAFDALVVGGSRAIFAFNPVEGYRTPAEDEREEKEEQEKKKEKIEEQKESTKKEDAKSGDDGKAAADDEEDTPFVDFETVAERWGFSFGYLPEEKDGDFDRHAALIEPGGKLETDIPWHSALFFDDLKPHWKVLYVSGTEPVVIERKYGNGSIVLVSDSFFLSNEAMRSDRLPRLLARLLSGPPDVVFDEEHHNVRDDPGIAALARKYRLHGVVATLFLIAALFVWKNATRFLPAYAEPAGSDVVTGKESGEGFVNLLRRMIRPAQIMEVCVAEWRKTAAKKPAEAARVEELWAQEQALPPRERDPISAYQKIAAALSHHRS